MNRHTDIFIRSYYKDFTWLAYCLMSIKKYCERFRKVIIVVPEFSKAKLDGFTSHYDNIFICKNYRDDYLGQQVTKLFADTFTDAAYICHLDSDCILFRTITPDDLFENGKVQFIMTPYSKLPRSTPWKRMTEKFLNHTVEYDFMRQQPLIYPRWLYQELQRHTQIIHGMDLESYIIAQPNRGFSEYNAMGAYAYYFHRDKFTWIDTSRSEPIRSFCKWYWSWGGISKNIKDEINKIVS